jgi:signal transduction histidine kinase
MRTIVKADARELNEEQLRANRYELVSRLADDLAHEIKNPLNAIVINLEVLKVRVTRADTQAALDRADVIEHEIRRLHHLVDRVLLLMRPERNDSPPLPLDTVLDELLPLIEAQTRLARNELRFTCDGAVFVPVTRDNLKFALLNVLVATHDHLGEGGGTLSLRCVADAEAVKIVVEAIHTVARPPDASTDDLARAVATAGALLGGSGARIETLDYGVMIRLPRSTSA